MKKGLYPILAMTLVFLLLLSFVFEEQLNALPKLGGVFIIVLTSVIAFGAILLAMWDTGMLGKKNSPE